MARETIILPRELYDTENIANGVLGAVKFFTTPLGGLTGAIRKTKNETNMTSAGALPAGQNFLVEGIAARLYATAAWLTEADFEAVYGARAHVEMVVNGNTIFEAPLRFIPSRGGAFVSGEPDASAAPVLRKYHVIGTPGFNNYYKWGRKNVLLRQNEDFYVEVNFAAAVTIAGTVYLTVMLCGGFKRLESVARVVRQP